MIVITVCFKKDGKNYQYLLHNPGNHKIDKNRPLVYTKGILYGKPDNVYLYPVSVERVEALPPIVTAQITLLSADNVIRVEKIGKITEFIKEKTEVEDVEVAVTKVAVTPTVTSSPKKETEIPSLSRVYAYKDPVINKTLKDIDKNIQKILGKRT